MKTSGIAEICGSIQALDVHSVGPQVRGYLDAGFSGERLLHEMGRVILKDDTGQTIVPTLGEHLRRMGVAERPSGAEPAARRPGPLCRRRQTQQEQPGVRPDRAAVRRGTNDR